MKKSKKKEKVIIDEVELKKKLDLLYRKFSLSDKYFDPIIFPKRFKNPLDIEAAAFISSCFAYGSVSQIIGSLENIFNIIGESPYDFCLNYSLNSKLFSTLKHRFFNDDDIDLLFRALKKIYSEYGSLERLFLLYYFEDDKNLKNSISFFSRNLINLTGKNRRSLTFMFPDPLKGSACKRMNLFLRWMIRKDKIDFGIWTSVDKSKLVFPVDVHIENFAKKQKITFRKNGDWKMAEEITDFFKRLDPFDPVKYDFAIFQTSIHNKKEYNL